MDVTRERISRILELREILLSFQTGFSLVSAAVVCANLDSMSGLEPSSIITEPKYMKHRYNINTNLIQVIKNLYNKATSIVLFNSSIEDWFRTTVGVRQGCVLSLPSSTYFWKGS